jgi:hypothetical protein
VTKRKALLILGYHAMPSHHRELSVADPILGWRPAKNVGLAR